jgi:hypothetical protein
VPGESRRRDRHRDWVKDTPRARLPCGARETEQQDVGTSRGSGKHAVALHLVLKPAKVLRAKIELQKQLERPGRVLQPRVPVRPDVKQVSFGRPEPEEELRRPPDARRMATPRPTGQLLTSPFPCGLPDY